MYIYVFNMVKKKPVVDQLHETQYVTGKLKQKNFILMNLL